MITLFLCPRRAVWNIVQRPQKISLNLLKENIVQAGACLVHNALSADTHYCGRVPFIMEIGITPLKARDRNTAAACRAEARLDVGPGIHQLVYDLENGSMPIP